MNEELTISKDSLISGILTLLLSGGIDKRIALIQIRKFAEDTRIEWETPLTN